jgi:hypothetical protein
VWVATPDDVSRYPGPDAAVITVLPTRAPLRGGGWVRPRPALLIGAPLGAVAGLPGGVLLAVLVGGIRLWAVAFLVVGGYLALVARLGRRRRRGGAGSELPREPALGPSLAIVAGLVVAIAVSVSVPILVWGKAFERLPDDLLDVLMPGAVVLGAVAGVGVALRTSLTRLLRLGRFGGFDARVRQAVTRFARRSGLSPRVGQEMGAPVRAADPFAGVRDGPEPADVAEWALGESLVTGPLRRAVRWRRRRALAAFETAARVSWWAGPDAAVVVDPPRELHRTPDGVLHRLDGPAVVWADGEPWFCFHGVRVPRRPDEGDWTVEEIHDTADPQARRVMIEAIGWESYVTGAGLELVAAAPDPAEPSRRLWLYRLPVEVYGPLRLLLTTDERPDGGGRALPDAEFVPDVLDDPVAAAAGR